ncbi:uncharacterized protein LOC111820006 [Trichechus manatus latirostris]|uniref:Uncharacterized protein LOC111820006 n=1 Tax=Trichechus manatus latirostris TaxID=127582 RepID=A0A2Y9QS29_TRIMA|nr:uncharacterized protein LOC111820006 [Trichechus manatus latirostris]
MLCALVETDTEAMGVSTLAHSLFLIDSEAFPAGRTQCLARHRVLQTPKLLLPLAGLQKGAQLAEGVQAGNRAPNTMLERTMMKLSISGQLFSSRFLGCMEPPEPMAGGRHSKYNPASFALLCSRRQVRPKGHCRTQALVSPLLMQFQASGPSGNMEASKCDIWNHHIDLFVPELTLPCSLGAHPGARTLFHALGHQVAPKLTEVLCG